MIILSWHIVVISSNRKCKNLTFHCKIWVIFSYAKRICVF